MEYRVGIVSDPIYLLHDTGNHPENSQRIRTILDTLQRCKIYGTEIESPYHPIPARKASLKELQMIHPQDFITQIEQTCILAKTTNKLQWLDDDTKVSADSFNAALYAVGGNFSAIDAIINQEVQRAFVICRPPGHHTNRDHARGFCVFNNIALTTEYLFRIKKIQRVAILDFDAHTGNGTQEIFYDGSPNGEILHIDCHQDPRTLYPDMGRITEIGRGKQQGKIINISFPPGSGDSVMHLAFEEIILPILNQFQPQILLISAGFDGWHNDPLTNLGFTTQLYGWMIQRLHSVVEKYAHGRISATLEGGYNPIALSQGLTNLIETMAEKPIRFVESEIQENEESFHRFQTKTLPELKSILNPYWKL